MRFIHFKIYRAIIVFVDSYQHLNAIYRYQGPGICYVKLFLFLLFVHIKEEVFDFQDLKNKQTGKNHQCFFFFLNISMDAVSTDLLLFVSTRD